MVYATLGDNNREPGSHRTAVAWTNARFRFGSRRSARSEWWRPRSTRLCSIHSRFSLPLPRRLCPPLFSLPFHAIIHGCSRFLLRLAAASPLRAEICLQGVASRRQGVQKLQDAEFRSTVLLVASGNATQCGVADSCVISSTRRSMLGVVALGVSTFGLSSFGAIAAGLPPEEKPKLCDAACEKELENVIKGLDEGILTMKVGGLRRLYIPGPLAFPKGLTSAPGRPRVAPSSPVIFDVNLLYIPGLDDE